MEKKTIKKKVLSGVIKKVVSKKVVVKKRAVATKKVEEKKVEIVPSYMNLRKLSTNISNSIGISFGCDPEAFFSKDGKIIGSEKVIPKDGLNNCGKVIRDGVQLEFNPVASTCRELLRGHIRGNLVAVDTELKKPENSGVKIDISQTVAITQEEMDSLSPESKQFGCVPSYNVYDDDLVVGVTDASKFFSRSAGGHIHLGSNESGTKILQDAKRLVPIFDLFVANTCVMIDTDMGNAIRRQTYGRAGEFRLPNYGIEYRTLSNFWLRNYTLMSFVMGLMRQAVIIHAMSTKENDYAGELMKLVDINDVRNAINNNDVELARKNFEKIKPFIQHVLIETNTYTPATMTVYTLKNIEKFLSKPLDYWFPTKDILGMWLGRYISERRSEGKDIKEFYEGQYGFESFLINIVSKDK